MTNNELRAQFGIACNYGEFEIADTVDDDDLNGHQIAGIDNLTCCGFKELSGFQDYNDDIKCLKYACTLLANWGKDQFHGAGIIAFLIEDRDDTFPLMDAFISGGWKQVMPPTKNPNSGNTLSGWLWHNDE